MEIISAKIVQFNKVKKYSADLISSHLTQF